MVTTAQGSLDGLGQRTGFRHPTSQCPSEGCLRDGNEHPRKGWAHRARPRRDTEAELRPLGAGAPSPMPGPSAHSLRPPRALGPGAPRGPSGFHGGCAGAGCEGPTRARPAAPPPRLPLLARASEVGRLSGWHGSVGVGREPRDIPERPASTRLVPAMPRPWGSRKSSKALCTSTPATALSDCENQCQVSYSQFLKDLKGKHMDVCPAHTHPDLPSTGSHPMRPCWARLKPGA